MEGQGTANCFMLSRYGGMRPGYKFFCFKIHSAIVYRATGVDCIADIYAHRAKENRFPDPKENQTLRQWQAW
jgi:hypothetical protein